MAFLHGFTWILIFQLIGESLVFIGKWPVPGPVVGMGLLFLALLLRRGIPEALDTSATALLAHLSLFFVPAGVGVMLHVDKLAGDWLAIAVSLLFGTLITLALTALLMHLLLRLQRAQG